MNHEHEQQRRFTRFIRVPTPGLRARLDVIEGDLLDISVSGALMSTETELPVGTEGHLLLDPGPSPISVVARVTRCDFARADSSRGSRSRTPEYVVGVRFVEPSLAAQRAIIGLCGGAQTIEEWPYQIVVLGESPELIDQVHGTLSQAGYQVAVAHDPESAVYVAKETHADTFLVSPAMIAGLLATRRPTKRTPIVAFARPGSMTLTEELLLEEHQIPLLTVPFTEGDLLEAARLALRRP